jgi:hypothetical protein
LIKIVVLVSCSGMIDANYPGRKEKQGLDRKKKEAAGMKIVGISALLIVLWLVVCMPELNRAMESAGSSSIIAVLHW